MTKSIAHGRKGLTLVEMLVATSLMAMVGATTVAVLTGGMKVWQRTVDYGIQEQSALIVLNGLQMDLRNARAFSLIPFKGKSNGFSFARVRPTDFEQQDAPDGMGRISYTFDARRNVLCRSFVPLQRISRSRDERCQVLLEGVERARMEYLDYADGDDKPRWRSNWEDAGFPLAVKATISLKGERGAARTHTFLGVIPTHQSDHEAS